MARKTKGRSNSRPSAKALRGNQFGPFLKTVQTELDTRLRGYFDAKLDDTRMHGRDVLDLVEALRDFCLRGGKRLRPALLTVGFRAASEAADLDVALDAGIVLELLQAYFLIHDDWMDQDATRRGGPAVHTLLGRRYRSPHLGSSAAILAGDLGVAWAADALARVEVTASRKAAALVTFAQMQADAVYGQQIDVLSRDPDVEKTYRLKTASYTVRGPLVLGAQLAGASASVTRALDRFSLPVGIAFQLRDDLLSAFGDPKQTGKPIGNDIKRGKRTALVMRGFELADGKDRQALKAAWGQPKVTQAELRRAVTVLERCGARQEVESRIEELVRSALSELAGSKVTRSGRGLLEGAARILTDRRS